MNLMEAFKALDKLDEEVFSVNDDGIKKLQNFINSDDSVDELDVYDLDVNEEENGPEECHVGDAILDCCVCHSKLFKPVSEIVVDEETQVANIGDECPYCYSVDGYKVVGEVKPMGEDDESSDEVEISDTEVTEDIDQVDISTDDVDIEIEDKDSDTEEETVEETSEEIIEESKRGKWRKNTVKEAIDLSTKKNTIAALLKDNMTELASIRDVNELRGRIVELVDNSDIADKPAAQKLKRDLFSKKSAGALLSTIATYMTGDKVIKTGRYKKAANESVRARKIRNRTVNELYSRKSIKESEITWPRNITSDKGRAFISELNDLLYNKYRFAGINPFGPGIVDGLDISKNQSKKFTNFTVYFNDVQPVSKEKLFGDNIDKHYSNFKNDFTNLVSEFDAQELIISDFDDKFHTVRIKIPNEWLMTESKSSRGYKEIIKESDGNEETIGDKLKKYQMWVDYDMEHYGKISETTQDIIDKEGLQLIKDQYGDYEVSVGHYRAESCHRKNKKSFKESSEEVTLEAKYEMYPDGRITSTRVTGTDEFDAFANLLDEIASYVTSDDVLDMQDEGESIDNVIEKIQSMNGDGSDFIFSIKNITTGKKYFDLDESYKTNLAEDVDEIEIKADDVKISIETEDETCEDCKDEVVAPVSEETMEEIDIENIDKDSVDEVTEECLKENYNNVKFFRSNNIKKRNNKFIVEGVIGFKSGKKKNTKFIFESNKTNRNKVTFSGKNSDLSLRKNNLLLTGKVVGKNLISESLKLK